MRPIYLFALLIVAIAENVRWKNCLSAAASRAAPITVSEIDLSPWPPVAGSELTVSLSSDIHKTLRSASFHVRVRFGSFTVVSERRNVCTADPATISCPLKAGPLFLTKTSRIPNAAPPGTYSVDVKVFDDRNSEVICAQLEMQISGGGPGFGGAG